MARIAVVDDHRDVARLVQHALARNHEVSMFTDSARALLAILEGDFDLIVTDVVMPGLNGYDLCMAVRSLQLERRPLVVLTSANAAESDIVRGLEAGAVDYLVKPLSMATVRAKISHYLTSPRAIAKLSTEVLSAPRSVPGRIVGDYELLSHLSDGGFSRVYKARRRSDGELVAMKILLESSLSDREALGRHFREVAILSLVQAPNLVRILDSGSCDGWPYLVMELVEGVNLFTQLEERGPLTVSHAIQVGIDVAGALSALHARGVVHRDVKPANILACPDRNVLIDVGASKTTRDHALTDPNSVLGTPGTMAPEVLIAAKDSPASDLYSLGATLYVLLTGGPPFVGPTVETMKMVARGAIAPLVSKRRPSVPSALATLVSELLSPKPANRPASADAVVARLEALAETLESTPC